MFSSSSRDWPSNFFVTNFKLIVCRDPRENSFLFPVNERCAYKDRLPEDALTVFDLIFGCDSCCCRVLLCGLTYTRRLPGQSLVWTGTRISRISCFGPLYFTAVREGKVEVLSIFNICRNLTLCKQKIIYRHEALDLKRLEAI